MLIYPTLKMAPIQGLTGFGGGATGNLVSGGSAGLYPFTSHKFTNAGEWGRQGPSLTTLRNAYDNDYSSTPVSERWWNDNNYFSLGNNVDGIQQWTVPATGNYSFEVVSPRAAYELTSIQQVGARVVFQISLIESQIIYMVCGQQGGIGTYNAGGMGGTFVFRYFNSSWDLLAAMGGAGGCGPNNQNQYQSRATASTGTSGNAGTNADHTSVGSSGGTNGQRGSKSTYNYDASPGGGWFTTTTIYGNQQCGYTVTSGTGLITSGSSITNGSFMGGYGTNGGGNNLNGGFGGGGGGSGACNSSGSGGGGGYSGGGVGNDCCNSWGGGGGSYVKTGLTVSSSIQNWNHAPTGGSYTIDSYVLVTKL